MSPASSRVRPVVAFLIAALLCQYGGVRAYAAQAADRRQASAARERSRPPAELLGAGRFDALLVELREVVGRARAKTVAAPARGFSEIEKLAELKRRLGEEREKVQAYFARVGGLIGEKALPAEIRNRHADGARAFEAKYVELTARLEEIESAHAAATGFLAALTGRGETVRWGEVIDKTLSFLDENASKAPRRHFDPHNLPHRSLKADRPAAPKLTREEWQKAFPQEESAPARPGAQKARGATAVPATDPPAPADLAETVEVQFTPEIRQLADSLEKNPVRIFNWVRNNVEFTPTWGSIQGAPLCLETKGCNAFDTASLLISLLRYSGIPARYQMGTVEVPVEKFKNWAGGFTNTEAAASFFASGGVPSVVRRVGQSGQVLTVRLEHVWVKAFADYAPSGGAVGRQGDTWVEMDPSFKQHTFSQGVDLGTILAPGHGELIRQLVSNAIVDPATGSVTKLDLQALASFQSQQSERLANHIRTNFPDATEREVFGGPVVAALPLPVLAAATPYRVLARAGEVAEIPDSLRHKVTIALGSNPQMPGAADQWSHTTSLPELARKHVSLLYAPATQADRDFLSAVAEASDGSAPLSVPSSVNFVARLYVGDELKATGQPLRAGSPVTSQIRFSSPTVSLPPISNSMVAGESAVIAFDLQRMPSSQMGAIRQGMQRLSAKYRQGDFSSITSLELSNLLLAASVATWFHFLDNANALTSMAAGIATVRYPSAGMLFVKQEVSSLFGAVASISPQALNMDIDADVVVSVAKDGDEEKTARVTRLQGALGSTLEAGIPEVMLAAPDGSVRGISTMSALAAANEQGIPIYRVDASNVSSITPRLQVSAADLADVQDAVNAGLEVVVSQQPVSFDGRPVLGLIVEDPRTGSASYLISGGTNGMLLTIIPYAHVAYTMNSEVPAVQISGDIFLSNELYDLVGERYSGYINSFGESLFLGSRQAECFAWSLTLSYVGEQIMANPSLGQCDICRVVVDMGWVEFTNSVLCPIPRAIQR